MEWPKGRAYEGLCKSFPAWISLFAQGLLACLQVVELAPIQKKLPEEVMTLVLGRLAPYELGRIQSVCKQWRELGSHDALWQPACNEAFWYEDKETTARLLKRAYRSAALTDLAADCAN